MSRDGMHLLDLRDEALVFIATYLDIDSFVTFCSASRRLCGILRDLRTSVKMRLSLSSVAE